PASVPRASQRSPGRKRTTTCFESISSPISFFLCGCHSALTFLDEPGPRAGQVGFEDRIVEVRAAAAHRAQDRLRLERDAVEVGPLVLQVNTDPVPAAFTDTLDFLNSRPGDDDAGPVKRRGRHPDDDLAIPKHPDSGQDAERADDRAEGVERRSRLAES